MIDSALWTYPCIRRIASIREGSRTEVVVEASTSTAAEDARGYLTTEGFTVGPVQRLGIRAQFDCPRNVSQDDPATMLRGIVRKNVALDCAKVPLLTSAPRKL